MEPLRVAVITGGHPFDVVGFHRLFRALRGCDVYIQALEDWAADVRRAGNLYDVLVFYHMHTALPQDGPARASSSSTTGSSPSRMTRCGMASSA